MIFTTLRLVAEIECKMIFKVGALSYTMVARYLITFLGNE